MTETNEDRGLEKHVDPDNPTGPKLTQRPDLSNREERPPTQTAQEPRVRNKSANRKKRSNSS